MGTETDSNLITSYEQLRVMSADMLRDGAYEVAYHVLMAGLECVAHLQDEQRLEAVVEEAKRQQDFVDQHAPDHRMATQVARERGVQNMYSLLIRQAEISLRQIRHNKRQAEVLKSVRRVQDS
ncbi:MAG: hypothetical protein Kow00121_22160 [Elainellaceae cyanobacterium]